MRQRSLFEWNIPGNPHARDSIASPRSSSLPPAPAGTIAPQSVRKTRDMCVIPDEDPNHPISFDMDDEEGHPFDLMGDGVGDEDDGGEDEDEGQELGSETVLRHKRQPLPPAVKDQYDKHLEYLRQTPHGSKPRLYEVHHTFMVTSSGKLFHSQQIQ